MPNCAFIPHDEATGLKTRCGARVCGFFTSLKERFYTSFTPVGFSSNTFLHLILHQFLESLLKEKVPVAVELRALFYTFSVIFIHGGATNEMGLIRSHCTGVK